MIIISRRAGWCPAGGRSRVPKPGEPHCPQSPRAAGRGCSSWGSSPECSALSPRAFSNAGMWEKHKPFPSRRSKKLFASTEGGLLFFGFFFFSLCYVFSGSRATASALLGYKIPYYPLLLPLQWDLRMPLPWDQEFVIVFLDYQLWQPHLSQFDLWENEGGKAERKKKNQGENPTMTKFSPNLFRLFLLLQK